MDYLEQAEKIFLTQGISKLDISNNNIRIPTLLYMIYWIERLHNNQEEQNLIKKNLNEYLNFSININKLFQSTDYFELVKLSNKYIKNENIPVQTIDLVIEKENSDSQKSVLLFERHNFPKGVALPGGLLNDSDEDNVLNVDAKTFAALRIAAEKVLQLDNSDRKYTEILSETGEKFYTVENVEGTRKVIIHPQNIYGYSVKENIKSVLRPSDPRHVVETVGFKCELVDSNFNNSDFFWETKSDLLNQQLKNKNKNFAFAHHKEIILHTLAKTTLENELTFNETNFVKNIIANPEKSFEEIKAKFEKNNFNPYTSFPELFPVVNKMLHELFTDDINTMCKDNKILIGFRDKVVNSLRHVSFKNRVFCPYLPTIQAIFDSVTFFDVIARNKKEFYNDQSSDSILEHNPKEKQNAAYHMYKYEYRMNELLSKIPDEIIIPTFTNLSATDLMKVRGVPIRFVGLSKDFLYVDEFEQSPEEFLMHDINHSYRMVEEDEKYLKETNISKTDFISRQNLFIKNYLNKIKINESDDEKTKELKKIKKIILFEIFHEEARPFLPEIALNSLLKKEGGETKFELPIIDEKTNYMDIVDVLDTEISTLAYVRSKLQCGFYDKIDKQNIYIVNPKYRKTEFIAEAAFELINDLSQLLNKKVTIDFEYVLKRVCSVGPNNIYEATNNDELLQKYNDGASFLNPKRYQSNQKTKFTK